MRTRFFSALALAAFVTIGATADAQPTGPKGRPGAPGNLRERRGEIRDRLKDLTPEQRKLAHDRIKDRNHERLGNLSEEQRAWIKSFREQTKSVHESVRAGTIDRATAASQLKAWREANPRPGKTNGSD